MTHVSHEFIDALKDARVFAPELPEAAAFDTLARLEELEATLIAPGRRWVDVSVADYASGSAAFADEARVYGNESSQTVASADHATDPYSRKNQEYRRADHGTGSLAMLLAERGESVSVVPLGRQTWNVAVSDDEHPVKREIRRLLPERAGFVSLHGMFSGKIRHVADPTEVHAVIGLGATPNGQSWQAARSVVAAGSDLGLRISIANEEKLHIYDPETGGLARDAETDELITSQLRGSKPAMTNALAYRIMEATGTTKRAMQIEMAAVLRMVALDDDGGWHKDRKARAMGVHLGYLLAHAAAQAVQTEYSLG